MIKLQLLLKLFLHFDLCACHSILERLPADQWRQNIADHFSRLWFTPPPVEIIERWLHSDELYHSHELIHDKDFNGYVQRLYNDGLLRKALTRETSALYYSRFILYRIWMLRERRDVHHVAMRDISRALEMNLGVMAGDPQPENEGALVGFLNHQMVMPQVRMSRTLIEARHLRDQITEAFNLGELDADLLPSLRQRMRSLDEHYPEAFRLLEEDAGQLAQLLDKDREVWL